ncbi:MAG: DUF1501 domain-containing protein [Oligoflexus sp.]|nr:DUF1501 domain-containing protein [Oligoflexus sp.]
MITHSRRDLLKYTGTLGLGACLSPWLSWNPKALANSAKAMQPVFVFLFLPGAMDGLSVLAPLDDPNYRKLRPNIGLNLNDERKPMVLSSGLYLHPALSPLKSMWDGGELSFVLGAGSPNASRSHFESQDAMQYGRASSRDGDGTGFLNRTLMSSKGPNSPLRAVAFESDLPGSLRGRSAALSISSLKQFVLNGGAATLQNSYRMMYEGSSDPLIRATSREAFDAQAIIVRINAQAPSRAVAYPQGPEVRSFQDLAAVIRADVGLEIAALSWGGWDTHVNQGGTNGPLAYNLEKLSQSLAEFRKDLGSEWQRTCVIAITEFGRTVKENGSRGTDHGHGSTVLMMGGSILGKRILGALPSLKPENLYEERDIPVVVDYRDILADVLQNHLHYQDLKAIFPDHLNKTSALGGLVKASG